MLTSNLLAQETPWLGLVPEVEHTEGELAGMTTYRLYLYTLGDNDFLSACSGDDENPLILTSTSEPSWFQHSMATTALATDINPAFFGAFPELAFDSWLTIGAEDNTAIIDVTSLSDPNYDAFYEFEDGNNVMANGPIGCLWFALQGDNSPEAISGEDERVLVAQLTTAGEISGQIYVQVFLNWTETGNDNEFREVVTILTACNDPEALNYEPLSFNADGCLYPPVDEVAELPESVAFEAFPSPADDRITVVFPENMLHEVAGATLEATSVDGRVVKAWVMNGGTQVLDVQGLASGQYVLIARGRQNEGLQFRAPLVVRH
ncbi:MAG: hypothetical protein ACPGYM_09155 [Flavobacteriales bacterium]